MTIQFTCHGCGRSLEVPDEKAGKVGRCRECGELVKVPIADGGYELDTLDCITEYPEETAEDEEDGDQPGIHPIVYGSLLIAAGVVAVIFWMVTGSGEGEEHVKVALNNRRVENTPKPLAVPKSPREDSPSQSPHEFTSQELFQFASPSVFLIESQNEAGRTVATGSGFFVKVPDYDKTASAELRRGATAYASDNSETVMYGVTNHHVIQNAVECVVRTAGGEACGVPQILKENADIDLAVLEVSVPRTAAPAPLNLGGQSRLPIGSPVFAIGSPFGLENSFSQGIVSGYRQIGQETEVIQTTAAIGPGSSGGPLLDERGQVVGVMTMSQRGGQSLNFGISASLLRAFLTGDFNPREIWSGRSISKRLDDERMQQQAIALRVVTDAAVCGKWLEGLTFSEQHNWESVIASIAPIVNALPVDAQYFAHYALAEAEWQTRFHGPVDAPTTREQIRLSSQMIRIEQRLKACLEQRREFTPALRLLFRHQHLTGSNAQSLTTANRILLIEPGCAEAHLFRGMAYDSLDDIESANKDYNTALGIDPFLGEAGYYLASNYSFKGDFAKAIAIYQSLIESNGYHLSLCHHAMGRSYMNVGQHREALRCFEQATSLGFPEDLCQQDIKACQSMLKTN